jgi:hypothetical protein
MAARATVKPARRACRHAGLPPGPRAGLPPCQLRRRRPLGDLNAAMRDLDAAAAEVQALLDVGKLTGFNISLRPGGRAAIRVLTASLEHYWQTGRALSLEWREVMKLLLPGDRPFVPGMEIQRSLNCDASHVTAMIRAGHLRTVRGSRCGWGGSPMVTRASLEAFLMKRLL